MKKVDLHIHTSSSNYEKEIIFSLDKIVEYVTRNQLDIIAITNHNHFDRMQFEEITSTLDCTVYPGIEVEIESSHLLVIFPIDKLEELEVASTSLSSKIQSKNDSISFEEFIKIFPDYKECILIPHIKKDPPMKITTLEKFKGTIKTGEVKSAKKFEVSKKDKNALVPVFFSDVRIEESLTEIPVRYTYLDINSSEYSVLKNALEDKGKVFISSNKKAEEFAFLSDGTNASTKLNVIMGKRSSGKTYNLKQIYNSVDENNIKFVKQFSLTGKSEEEKFEQLLSEEQQSIINEYLLPLRKLVDNLLEIDNFSDQEIDKYLASLKEYATNQSLQDAYSKSKLFNETEFAFLDSYDTKKVINAITVLLDSKHNEEIIEKYISKEVLKRIFKELLLKRNIEFTEYKLKQETDRIVKIIKEKLTSKSSMTSVSKANFYKAQKDKILINEFNNICNRLKSETVIYNLDIYRFKLSVSKSSFKTAQDVKARLKTSLPVASNFNSNYSNPYKYIQGLAEVGIPKADIYKAIINFNIKVINEKGNRLSGGERAEYNLLREIKGSEQYDILLLDEPEASFDNPFIKDYIIEIIKDISQKTTVFITTHNNSLGILIRPNKLIYTSNEDDGFKVYTGEFGSRNLTTIDGKSIISYDNIMEVMEAGIEAYEERKQIYESFKN